MRMFLGFTINYEYLIGVNNSFFCLFYIDILKIIFISEKCYYIITTPGFARDSALFILIDKI